MKTLFNIYSRKLDMALNNLETAKANTESTPAESEEEAEFLFKIAEKQLIAAKQRVSDLQEFLSDIKVYL